MDKQHIIYKITNNLNNRFYIGMHTGYPNDRYFGSGKRLKVEITKYGKENFKKEILEILPNRKLLELREAEIVNEELLANPLCLNLKNGGEGGGKFWNEEHRLKATLAGLTSPNRNHVAANRKARQTKLARGTNLGGSDGFRGKQHTQKTRDHLSIVMSEKQSGEKNSQFGTCWVTNGTPIKIKKERLDEYLADGYSRGRKMPL